MDTYIYIERERERERDKQKKKQRESEIDKKICNFLDIYSDFIYIYIYVLFGFMCSFVLDPIHMQKE